MYRCCGALAVLAVAVGVTGVGGQGRQAFVVASRVLLRSGPDATAPVIGAVTANTPVATRGDADGRCAVTIEGTGATGYLPCLVLRDRPLTLDEVSRALATPDLGAPARLDWEARGFWMSPSLARLVSVGDALENHWLTHEIATREDSTGRSERFRDPEFEAMKARLAATAIGAQPPRFIERDSSISDRVWKRMVLPDTGASFFRADDTLEAVALGEFGLADLREAAPSLADALSASTGSAYHAARWRPIRFSHIGPLGTWDVGGVDLRFSSPATLHAVTRQGAVTGFAVTSLGIPLGGQTCAGSPVAVRGTALPGWRNAVVGWAGRPPPGPTSVTSKVLDDATTSDRLAIDTVDVDRDGRPDLVRWSGTGEAAVDGVVRWAAVYANVGGTWALKALTIENECT